MLVQVCREVGCRAVRVVTADRVQDVDAVALELLGGDVERVLALLDQAALDAVLDVGQLHPAVADRAAAEAVQQVRAPAHLVGDLHRVAGEQAGIPARVGDEPDVRRNLGVALDESAHSRGQAGREPAGGEHGDGPHSHGPTLPVRRAPCQSGPSGQRMAMTAPARSQRMTASSGSVGRTRTRGAGPLVDVEEDRRAPAGRARLVVPDDLRVVVGRLVEQLLGTGPPAVRRGALVGVVVRRGGVVDPHVLGIHLQPRAHPEARVGVGAEASAEGEHPGRGPQVSLLLGRADAVAADVAVVRPQLGAVPARCASARPDRRAGSGGVDEDDLLCRDAGRDPAQVGGWGLGRRHWRWRRRGGGGALRRSRRRTRDGRPGGGRPRGRRRRAGRREVAGCGRRRGLRATGSSQPRDPGRRLRTRRAARC